MGGGPRPCVRTDRSLRGDERARMKREPRRTCLGCRRVRPKEALVRLVRGRDGVVVADPRGGAAGRGAYVWPGERFLECGLGRAPLTPRFRKPREARQEVSTGA